MIHVLDVVEDVADVLNQVADVVIHLADVVNRVADLVILLPHVVHHLAEVVILLPNVVHYVAEVVIHVADVVHHVVDVVIHVIGPSHLPRMGLRYLSLLHHWVMRDVLDNLPWPGFRPDGGLLLPLPTAQWSARLPPALAWSGPTLRRKHEFHATLLNRACGSAARQALGDEGVRRLFQAQDWTLRRTGDARLLHKPGKPPAHSLIEILDLPALAAFRNALADATGQELPPVPPHVTLYTAGKPEGIGLPDNATLERFQIARLRLPGIGNRPPPPLPDTLEAAYRATEYRVDEAPGLIIRIGEHQAACDALLDRHHVTRALLLSACNPYSEPGSEAGNQLRHALLATPAGLERRRRVAALN